MQLGDVGWSQLKNKSCHHHHCQVKMSMVAVHYQMKARRRGGKRSMKNFSLFIARCDSISFCFASVTPLPTSSIMLELAHSIKVPQSIFQEIENERCFIRNAGSNTSLLFNSNVQNTMFGIKLKKSHFITLRAKRAIFLGPLMTSVASNGLSDIKWDELHLTLFEVIRGHLRILIFEDV